MRKMALDYGEVRIGIAFSDILNIIANGYETYTRKNLESDLEYLNKLVKEKEVDTISLESAKKSIFWQLVWAAEPEREIDVRMTYDDLKMCIALIRREVKKDG